MITRSAAKRGQINHWCRLLHHHWARFTTRSLIKEGEGEDDCYDIPTENQLSSLAALLLMQEQRLGWGANEWRERPHHRNSPWDIIQFFGS